MKALRSKGFLWERCRPAGVFWALILSTAPFQRPFREPRQLVRAGSWPWAPSRIPRRIAEPLQPCCLGTFHVETMLNQPLRGFSLRCRPPPRRSDSQRTLFFRPDLWCVTSVITRIPMARPLVGTTDAPVPHSTTRDRTARCSSRGSRTRPVGSVIRLQLHSGPPRSFARADGHRPARELLRRTLATDTVPEVHVTDTAVAEFCPRIPRGHRP
jgi:hypothetical protein